MEEQPIVIVRVLLLITGRRMKSKCLENPVLKNKKDAITAG